LDILAQGENNAPIKNSGLGEILARAKIITRSKILARRNSGLGENYGLGKNHGLGEYNGLGIEYNGHWIKVPDNALHSGQKRSIIPRALIEKSPDVAQRPVIDLKIFALVEKLPRCRLDVAQRPGEKNLAQQNFQKKVSEFALAQRYFSVC
jgi:hypothetical protein